MKRKRQQGGRRSDDRALAAIAGAGWELTRTREMEHGFGRFVARQRTIEEDHTITYRFESSFTLEGLAKNVLRREHEIHA